MSEESRGQALSIEEAREAIAGAGEQTVGVIDVRPAEEFGDAHIVGAVNVPDGDGEAVRAAIGERDDVDRWVLACDDGGRSADLASELSGDDVEISYLEGGTEAWAKDDLPMQPPEPDLIQGPKSTTLY
jgi:rhodanese-related sulfurtransferase